MPERRSWRGAPAERRKTGHIRHRHWEGPRGGAERARRAAARDRRCGIAPRQRAQRGLQVSQPLESNCKKSSLSSVEGPCSATVKMPTPTKILLLQRRVARRAALTETDQLLSRLYPVCDLRYPRRFQRCELPHLSRKVVHRPSTRPDIKANRCQQDFEGKVPQGGHTCCQERSPLRQLPGALAQRGRTLARGAMTFMAARKH